MDEQGNLFDVIEAGPGRFIEDALLREDIPLQPTIYSSLTVEIRVTATGEFGMVPTKPTPRPIPPLFSDWAIVSTVLDEWDLSSITVWPEHLFVDLQGYVRDGKNFGEKRRWDALASFANGIFCLKGTQEEFEHIPKVVFENQKKRTLVITNGSQSVDLFYRGVFERIPVRPLTGLKDTIGAGDNFLAYLVAAMYKGKDALAAVQYATKMTARFLEEKKLTTNLST